MLKVLASAFKASTQLRLENFALRHQLIVLRRSTPKRLKLTTADRIFWLRLRRVWTDWRSFLIIVTPETVVAWHRKGFRLFWTWKIHRGQPGRPRVSEEVRDLIRMMSRNNPRWGAPRIHGELLKLGIEITEPTVAKYMVRSGKPPSQSWRAFLHNHVKSMVWWTSSWYRQSGSRSCTYFLCWHTIGAALSISASQRIQPRSGQLTASRGFSVGQCASLFASVPRPDLWPRVHRASEGDGNQTSPIGAPALPGSERTWNG